MYCLVLQLHISPAMRLRRGRDGRPDLCALRVPPSMSRKTYVPGTSPDVSDMRIDIVKLKRASYYCNYTLQNRFSMMGSPPFFIGKVRWISGQPPQLLLTTEQGLDNQCQGQVTTAEHTIVPEILLRSCTCQTSRRCMHVCMCVCTYVRM